MNSDRPRTLVWLALLSLGAAIGCAESATDPSAVSVTQSALTHDAVSIACDPSLQVCPVLKDPMSGTWPSSYSGGKTCEGCRFTNGADQQASGVLKAVKNIDTVDLCYGWTLPAWDAYGGLQSRWTALANQSRPFLDPATPGSSGAALAAQLQAIKDDLELFTLLGGSITGPDLTTKTWKVSFRPTTGRGYVSPAASGARGYSGIVPLQELRDRGARSYCAMREATYQQNGGALDLGGGSSGNALGWDVGKAYGSLRLFPPKRVEGAVDGTPTAEAYVMPMTVSAKLTPAVGRLLPDFGELAHPLMWMTGDAEVITLENPASEVTRPCPWCPPIVKTIYTKTARNLYHADLMAGVSTNAHIGLDQLVLADLGLVKVYMGGDIDIALGQLDVSNTYGQGGVAASGLSSWRAPRPTALSPAGTQACDAAFSSSSSSSWAAYAEGGLPFAFESASGQSFVRWNSADDRSLVVRDTISESINAGCDLGLDFGPLDVGIKGQTTLAATSEMNLVVREHLSAVDAALAKPTPGYRSLPQTNFLVVPELHSDVNAHPLDIFGYFHLHIDLLFTDIDIDWQEKFFSLREINITNFNDGHALSGEDRRLRVGEFSEPLLQTVAPSQPSVYSHLPGTTNGFASFPVNLTTCLNDPKQPPQPSKINGPKIGEGPIKGATCAYGFVSAGRLMTQPMPKNICSSAALIDGWVAGARCGQYSRCANLKACYGKVLAFLCKQTSLQQTYNGENVLSHVLATGAGFDDSAVIGTLIQECTAEYAYNAPDKQTGETVAKQFNQVFVVPAHACHSDATLDW